MKDKNGVEIKVGSLVKRCGNVLYADGLKYKISKKTWLVSKVENDKVFYFDENGNDVYLPCPKNEGDFLVVGEDGKFFPEHAPMTKAVKVSLGGVGQKYRVHGEVKEKKWADGDIVLIYGTVEKQTLDSGKLERVPDTLAHKHVLIVADPIKVFGKAHANIK